MAGKETNIHKTATAIKGNSSARTDLPGRTGDKPQGRDGLCNRLRFIQDPRAAASAAGFMHAETVLGGQAAGEAVNPSEDSIQGAGGGCARRMFSCIPICTF